MKRCAYILCLAFIFTIPLENSVTISGIGTLTKGVGFLLALVWGVSVCFRKVHRKLETFHFAAFLFLTWNIVSALWTIDPEMTLTRIKTYSQLVVMCIILWDLLRTPKTLRAAIQTYILGACVAIASLLFNVLTHQALSEGRFAASGFNPNDFSLIVALGLPLAWHLAVLGDTVHADIAKGYQYLNFLYIPLALGAILLTASRGSMIAVFPGILFILLSLNRVALKARIPILMATGIALYLFVPMVPDTSMDRLKSTFETMAQGDLGGRLRIWTASFAVFVQHPLTGVGSGALPSVHNVYLSILAETGLFGLLSFLFVVATAVRAIFQQSRPYFWLWLTVFIIWSIGASVHTWEQRKPTWLFLLLMVTSAAQFKMSPNGMDTALAQSA